MHRLALPLVVGLALAACQTTRYEGDESSPYYAPPVGTRVILNRAITIPPEQVSVMLQNGRIVPPGEINTYYPHCKFEVRRRLDVPQTVKPDEFVVTRVERNLLHSVEAGTTLHTRASVGIGIGIGVGGGVNGDGPSVQTYATRMDLRSDTQPDVFRLTCGQWGYPYDGEHVSVNGMRKALGDVITLRLPPPHRQSLMLKC